jgi:hypothetical protein
MLTLEEFDKLENGIVFDKGTTFDDLDGINMFGTKDPLRWIAKKGYADDWCIYTYWAYNSWDFIENSGEKVMSKENIMNVVPCSEEVFLKYRY